MTFNRGRWVHRTLTLYPQKLNEISGLVLDPSDDIPAFGDEKELEDYFPSRVRAQGISSKNPLAIIAPRQFERIYAQEGTFTIIHKKSVQIDQLQDKNGAQHHLVKLKIRRAAMKRLREELEYLRVNKLTVFPQLENVASNAVETTL